MKRLLAALLFLPLAAFAQTINLPGTVSVATPNPQDPQAGTWSYSISATVVVSDAPGFTNTQGTVIVAGNAVTSACSGRGCNPATRVNDPQGVTLTDASGATVATFTATPHQQTCCAHAVWHTWVADAPVPVGTYTLTVSGTASCFHRPLCSGSQSVIVGGSVTHDPLPVTYWWTGSVDPQLQGLGVTLRPAVIATLATDTSGPQQVCDLYDGQIQVALQAFFDIAQPKTVLINGVTSTADNGSGQWACTYLVDLSQLDASGAVISESVVPTASGLVTVATGSIAPVVNPILAD